MQQRAVKIAPETPTPAKPVAAPSGAAGFSLQGLVSSSSVAPASRGYGASRSRQAAPADGVRGGAAFERGEKLVEIERKSDGLVEESVQFKRKSSRGGGGGFLSLFSKKKSAAPPPVSAAKSLPTRDSAKEEEKLARSSSDSSGSEDEKKPSPTLATEPKIPPAAPTKLEAIHSVAPASPAGNINEIASVQKANGSWNISILSKLGISVDVASKALPATAQGKQDAMDVWATVLVVLLLGAKFGGIKVEWDLLAKKAMKWVQKVGKTIDADLNWEEKGKQFLQTQGISF